VSRFNWGRLLHQIGLDLDLDTGCASYVRSISFHINASSLLLRPPSMVPVMVSSKCHYYWEEQLSVLQSVG
jgi:hypothetical protein